MTGILLILFFIIGFIVYIWLIWLPIKWAKEQGFSWRKQLYIGIAGFFVVSAVFFGKNLISYTAFKYYCNSEAGMTVYKTLDEWKKENPGVWETLEPTKGFTPYKDRKKYPDVPLTREFNGEVYKAGAGSNQRIVLYDRTDYPFWGAIDKERSIFIDNKTQEVLANNKFYRWTNTWDTTPNKNGWRGRSYLGNEVCKSQRDEYFDYVNSFSNFNLAQEEK